MRPFLHMDCGALAALMPGGTITALRAAADHAVAIDQPAGGPGALDNLPLRYGVVDGVMLRRVAPAAVAFFRSPEVLALLSGWAGVRLRPCGHAPAFINVNVMRGGDIGYQWHQDGNPVTLLVFLSSFLPQDGGALMVKVNTLGPPLAIRPEVGHAVLFSGAAMAHGVEPVAVGLRRLSVPVAYELEGEPDRREVGDDAYLYGAAR